MENKQTNTLKIGEIVVDAKNILSDTNDELNRAILAIKEKYPEFNPRFTLKQVDQPSGQFKVCVILDSKGFLNEDGSLR